VRQGGLAGAWLRLPQKQMHAIPWSPATLVVVLLGDVRHCMCLLPDTLAAALTPVLAVGGMLNLLCRLYNTLTGSCLATLTGHDGEISKVSFNPQVRILQPTL
jgi:WD40 repeat protein